MNLENENQFDGLEDTNISLELAQEEKDEFRQMDRLKEEEEGENGVEEDDGVMVDDGEDEGELQENHMEAVEDQELAEGIFDDQEDELSEEQIGEGNELNELYLKVESKRKFYQMRYPKQKKVILIHSVIHALLAVLSLILFVFFTPALFQMLVVVELGNLVQTLLAIFIFGLSSVDKLNTMMRYVTLLAITNMTFIPLFYLLQGTTMLVMELAGSKVYTQCFFFCIVRFSGGAQTFFFILTLLMLFITMLSSFLLGCSQFYYVLYRESELLLPSGVRKYGLSNIDEMRLLKWRNIGVMTQRVIIWLSTFLLIIHSLITLFVPIPYIAVFYGNTTPWFFANISMYILQCAFTFIALASLYLLITRNNFLTSLIVGNITLFATILSFIYSVSVTVYVIYHSNQLSAGDTIIGAWYSACNLLKTLICIVVLFFHLMHAIYLIKFPQQSKVLYYKYVDNKANNKLMRCLPFGQAEPMNLHHHYAGGEEEEDEEDMVPSQDFQNVDIDDGFQHNL